jgi:hypothetical protein
MPSPADLFKRAFAGFASIAKRDPKDSGAIEVDLAKVAAEIGKAAASFGPTGDVGALETALEEIGTFLEKATHDPSTDKVYAATSDIAKRFAIDEDRPAETEKADGGLGKPNLPADQGGQYYEDHGSGRAKPPAKGSKEQRANQYTAGSGLATDSTEPYTASSSASVAKTPSGGDATSFDQPASTKKVAKAQQPSHPETPGAPGMLLAEDHAETQAPMVSEGFGMRGKKAGKVSTKKSAAHITTEELWARDMSAMTGTEVEEIRKAAREGALDGETDGDEHDDVDDRSAPDAKRKKAKKTQKKAPSAGPQGEVDELEDEDRDEEAASAVKPNASAEDAGEVDEVGKTKKAKSKKTFNSTDQSQAVDEADDEDEEKACKAKKAKKADPDDDGDDDSDEEDDEEDEDEEHETKKSADDEAWEVDLAPASMPVGRVARLTSGELAVKADGARTVAKRHAKIRKDALAGLSPDQVAELQKSARKSSFQKQRERVRALKSAGYEAGSRELEINGVEDATVEHDEKG